MNIIHSLILGVVEGITEFLPISSTAHLVLTSKLLGLAQSDFMKSYEIVIQFGAILAVLYLYWRDIIKNKSWFLKVLVAFIPTGIIGLLLYKLIKNLFMSSYLIMTYSLLIGGVLLILFELLHKEKELADSDISDLSWGKCVAIGCFQSLAVVPGVSRAAATIIGGLLMGIKRKTIVEFSFLLAVPTMLMASLYDLYKNGSSFASGDIMNLAIGFIASFLVAVVAIKFLLNYVRKNNFIPFGIYRIVIALIFLLFIL